MDLSVIIPCHNAEGAIGMQLEALAKQVWTKQWELIISDNGSTDRSLEIVESYRHRLPCLKIVDSSARQRQSFALNSGARAAQGKGIVFCDADDEVAPGWLAAMGDALADHDVVHGTIAFDKFNDPKASERLAGLWKGGLYRGQFLPHAGAANIGVKPHVHAAIGGFDEGLPRFADGDYSWRLQLEGFEFFYEPRAVYQYRIGRVNNTLPYLFRRGWTAPAADYWTYKKFRKIGITKEMILPCHRTLKKSIGTWLRLVKIMPRTCLKNPSARLDWLRQFVTQSGEVYGQVLGRVKNPCRPYEPNGDAYRKIINYEFRTTR